MRVGQAPQHKHIHDRKNCGVRADGKRQREHYCGSETGIAPQLPEGEFKILCECSHRRSSFRMHSFLLGVATPTGGLVENEGLRSSQMHSTCQNLVIGKPKGSWH